MKSFHFQHKSVKFPEAGKRWEHSRDHYFTGKETAGGGSCPQEEKNHPLPTAPMRTVISDKSPHRCRRSEPTARLSSLTGLGTKNGAGSARRWGKDRKNEHAKSSGSKKKIEAGLSIKRVKNFLS